MTVFFKEIKRINIELELKRSYLDYAMSVIIGRALPDVRDGLKPVHRRILFAMKILGNDWNKSYKKSARIVGDVIGKYHPHGDSAVYDALVRMAQSFSLRYMLVDGQGNFGSIDGDSAAAMRYTEVRMSKISHELLSDLEKNTVNFVDNYDETEKIPEVLPTKIPNLLINGSSGIAVGMATNIPPHNLKEVINGCLAYISNTNISTQEIMKYIPGPDFPTSGIINGQSGIIEAYNTGKGKISVRSCVKIEINPKTKKESIIIYQLPYQVNKSRLMEKIAELVREKRIDGISALRDESDKDGMRIVIEIKRESITEVILNKLYLLTQLQVSFGINMVALCNGQPKILNIKEIISLFIEHRKEIVRRRTIFELKKFVYEAHLSEGFIVALNNVPLIIEIIKEASSFLEAKNKLLANSWKLDDSIFFSYVERKKLALKKIEIQNNGINDIEKIQLSDVQAKSVLELKIHKLTNLEQKKVRNRYKSIVKKIEKLVKVLRNEKILMKIIKMELKNIKDTFGDSRRTKIIVKKKDINIEDIINKEDVVVTLSNSGYVKYQPISEYNAQKRGGKGKSAIRMKEEDFIASLLVANTHDSILCFSSKGNIYWMKVYQLPEASRNARGKPIVNLLPLSNKERITTILPINKYNNGIHILMATAKGIVKKTKLSEFKRPRSKGIIAINLRNDDELIGVSLTSGKDHIMLFTKKGKVVRFSEDKVRSMGRTAAGIIGIKLGKMDRVVSLIIPRGLGNILTVAENGYGKQTKLSEFPIKSRATKGVIAIKITNKNRIMIGAIQVTSKNQVMMITNAGTLVRTRVSEVCVLGRNTQGVILIRTTSREKVVALQRINESILNS